MDLARGAAGGGGGGGLMSDDRPGGGARLDFSSNGQASAGEEGVRWLPSFVCLEGLHRVPAVPCASRNGGKSGLSPTSVCCVLQ